MIIGIIGIVVMVVVCMWSTRPGGRLG